MIDNYIHKPSGKPLSEMNAWVLIDGKLVETQEPLTPRGGELNAHSMSDLSLRVRALTHLFAKGDIVFNRGYYGGVLAEAAREFVSEWNDKAMPQKWRTGMPSECSDILAALVFDYPRTISLYDRLLSRKNKILPIEIHTSTVQRNNSKIVQLKEYNDDTDFTVGVTKKLTKGEKVPHYPNMRIVSEWRHRRREMTVDDFFDSMEEMTAPFILGPDRVFLEMLRLCKPEDTMRPGERCDNPHYGKEFDNPTYDKLSAKTISKIRGNLASADLPATALLTSFDGINEVLSDPNVTPWFDPCYNLNLILEGTFGSILGAKLQSDCMRVVEHQVMRPGECFVLPPPSLLGEYMNHQTMSGNGSRGDSVYCAFEQSKSMFVVAQHAVYAKKS